ncbi:hypothetical protein EAO76_24595 [Streptomyces sp. sk2.1]|nr:hypothetical protein EAO76_24595 [Streptomyces sp. sk2.1]
MRLPRLLGPRPFPGTPLLPLLDLQLPDPAPDLTQLPLQPGRPGPSRRRRGCCPAPSGQAGRCSRAEPVVFAGHGTRRRCRAARPAGTPQFPP